MNGYEEVEQVAQVKLRVPPSATEPPPPSGAAVFTVSAPEPCKAALATEVLGKIIVPEDTLSPFEEVRPTKVPVPVAFIL